MPTAGQGLGFDGEGQDETPPYYARVNGTDIP